MVGSMSTEVVMPQMGESIAEGTVVRWIKKVGDHVERDEPLFEISTDKVDAEIPSPAAGVLVEIRTAEGETVPVNSVVAVIGGPGARPPAGPASPAVTPSAASGGERIAPQVPAAAEAGAGDDGAARTSPLVRKLAKEHGVDLSRVRGTGLGGRVTKDDVLAFVAAPRAEAPAATGVGKPGRRVEPMSIMRRRIAERMVASQRTSAHTHTVFEVDFERVAAARKARTAEFERAGVKLTYLAFILKAAAAGLREVPIVNASVEGDAVVYHDDVHIGVAVALDGGLIVPVLRHVDRTDMLDLSRTIADLAERARTKRLKPDEVAGGTFTITNPGMHGALFGTPIINQPQVAILGVGSIARRPVVVGDALAARLTAHLSLGFDHRVIDGAIADQFMAHVKRTIEEWGNQAEP
jgi:2-oxoglutarate dehydrogenase E2 component (dihydrolipoamide succinyltransferase)